MDKKLVKKGFTIAEMVVCFVLMGIVLTAVLPNISSHDNYQKLYYKAFDTLYQATSNIYLHLTNAGDSCSCNSNGDIIGTSGVNINCYDQSCWSAKYNGGTITVEERELGGTPGLQRETPGILYGGDSVGLYDGSGTDEAFCKLITSEINTILASSECKSFITTIKNELGKKIEFCTISNGKEKCSEQLEPSFISANGQRFYISSIVSASDLGGGFGESFKKRQLFRFVIVDLNGESNPNTNLIVGRKLPDWVLFAITSNGSVIPLGLPEFSKSYINAYVSYPSFITKQNNAGNIIYEQNKTLESPPYTLWEAKQHAWAEPITASVAPLGMPAVAVEPFTLSNIFYMNAGNSCASYQSGCNSPSSGKYADALYVKFVNNFLYVINSKNGYIKPAELTTRKNIQADSDNGCAAGDTVKCKIELIND